MSAPKNVLALIENFERNRDAYHSGKYNETQVRRDFIDPFFKELGWDIDNSAGYAEAYRDVIHEDSIKIGTSTKAPDYCFRIGGQRKFFLEAKKPSVNIKTDIEPAFQLRRYAWSANLPLSIVTDFEEFAIYDCRKKPDKNDKASASRLFYCTFDEYADRWEEIAGIFSKDSVLKGSFDKYAHTSKGKKGTTEVDSAFLEEIERWRDLLARNIALRNAQISQGELNFAVQQTIDRIIFLRICEDRGIEPYGRLQALANGKDVYSRLTKIFKDADDRYNSGLFHFSKEKNRNGEPDELTPQLHIDDKPLKDIFSNLYYPDCPYEFSVLGADILGSVYEQFLGKVIRLTAGNRAVVEDKPEVKKAGGVFYTPTYVVQYIVKNTIGSMLDGKSSKQAEGLRVLDPACGSGSFLIGAYQYLLDWHLSRYEAEDADRYSKGKAARVRLSANGEWRLTTAERKRILLEHIYGVDIDAQAVEVTKLSLLLKVLEGESDQTLTSQMKLFHERVLPDLDRNIQCGNSLVGPDFYDGELSLEENDVKFVNVFDWRKSFGHVFKEKGFDVVIGNPPYGASVSLAETRYFGKKYQLQDYQLDSYFLFIERSLEVLRPQGLLGFIIPNTWLLNLKSSKIRQHLFSKTAISNIVHYQIPVFKQAVVDTEIMIFVNENPDKSHEINVEIYDKSNERVERKIKQKSWIDANGAPVSIFDVEENDSIKAKISGFPVLDDVCKITQGAKPFQVGKGSPKQTRQIVDEKPFVKETKIDKTFRPLLRGSLMNRYQINWNENYFIKFGDWLAEPRYSAEYDVPEKIVIRQTGDHLCATLDTEQFVVRDNLYTIVGKGKPINLRYVLGLINSKFLNWYYQNVLNPEKGEALAQVKRGHLAKLPIRIPNPKDKPVEKAHDSIVLLVEKILTLQRQLAKTKVPQEKTSVQRQIDASSQQIDGLVYVLYELSVEEIELIERSE